MLVLQNILISKCYLLGRSDIDNNPESCLFLEKSSFSNVTCSVHIGLSIQSRIKFILKNILIFKCYLLGPHGGLASKDLLLSERLTTRVPIVLPRAVVVHNLGKVRDRKMLHRKIMGSPASLCRESTSCCPLPPRRSSRSRGTTRRSC